MTPDASPHGAPLAALLAATALEVDALARDAERLQPLVAQAVQARASAGSIADAQVMDHLLQHFDALASFIAALAAATPGDVRVDAAAALAGVTLGEFKRRLLGDRRPPEAAGELEMF